MKPTLRRDLRRGSSLVEILVVIVIFTIGILAVVQIFPTGLGILRTSRAATVGHSLARAQMESLKVNVEQLPEAIVTVGYVGPPPFRTVIELDRLPTELAPAPYLEGPNSNGNLDHPQGADMGYWPYFTGANTYRRVIGEGRRIPAPQFVPTGSGARYGSLMSLQFGPVFVLPNFVNGLLIYGNDLNKRWVDQIDPSNPFPLREDYVCFIDDDGTTLTLPQGPARPSNPTYARTFRISASARYQDGGGGVVRRTSVITVQVPQATGARVNYPIDLVANFDLYTAEGLSCLNVEPDTLTAQRVFDQVSPFTTEAAVQGNPALRDDASYECEVLNLNLGTIIFNPIGSTYREQRARGRVPMVARVDYDVLDWQILRDDFRVPSTNAFQYKLMIDSLRVAGLRGPDNFVHNGMALDVPNGAGGTRRQDFILIDRESGAIYMPSSYNVDKSAGIITFRDVDNNAANGLTADVVLAQATVSSRINDIRGRSVRALYQGNGNLAVQIIKPASQYRVTDSATLGYAQCYVGGSNINVGVDDPRRIYFPLNDAGKKVVVGEAWYQDGSGRLQSLREQEFKINAPGPNDWGAMAYIDLREKAPAATTFDFSRGYAVRRVRGASVAIRVLWNPATFRIGADQTANRQALGNWLSQTRVTTTETFLMKGEQQ